jgi:hypothetical protein
MSLGEKLIRWSIVVGFALLSFVTGLAAVLIFLTKQRGNIWLLSLVAIGSALVSLALRRSPKRAG